MTSGSGPFTALCFPPAFARGKRDARGPLASTRWGGRNRGAEPVGISGGSRPTAEGQIGGSFRILISRGSLRIQSYPRSGAKRIRATRPTWTGARPGSRSPEYGTEYWGTYWVGLHPKDLFLRLPSPPPQHPPGCPPALRPGSSTGVLHHVMLRGIEGHLLAPWLGSRPMRCTPASEGRC